jgi:hypothetical protein
MHVQAIFGGVMFAPDTNGQLIGGLGHALDLAKGGSARGNLVLKWGR